jgi:hypothetical protein
VIKTGYAYAAVMSLNGSVGVMTVVYAANIGEEVTDFFGSVINVAVKVLVFLLIMAIGWFIAKLVYGWVRKLLMKVGFDRAVDRGGLQRVMGSWSASDLVAKIVQYGLLLVTLQLAFGVFGPNPVSELIHGVIAWLPQLFIAVVIVVVATAIAGAVKDLINRTLHGLSYGGFLATVAQIAIVAIGIIAALNQAGIGVLVTMPLLIGAVATIAGILIVGVGGGLIKPMQNRWERMLDRAESEASTAADRVKSNMAANARNVNASTGFEQPSYGGGLYGSAAHDEQIARQAERATQQDQPPGYAEPGHPAHPGPPPMRPPQPPPT